MSTASAAGVIRRLGADPPTDADLVSRYARHADPAAFADLLRRHGPVVLGVCRRLLANAADADDAFQAVFLVLARKAAAVDPPGRVGGWLYGVAVRTARKAKVAAARRRRREMRALASGGRQPPESSASALERAELRAAVDAELDRLPTALRDVIVLCDLGGKTRSEAARELGCPDGTVAARLHRGRKRLAEALARRGVALPAAAGAVLTPAAVTAEVPAELARLTLAAAAGGPASPVAAALAEGVMRSLGTSGVKLAVLAAVAGGLLTVGAVWHSPAADPPPTPLPPVVPKMAHAPAPTPAADVAGYVADVQFSGDGTLYAVVAGGKVAVYDTATQKEVGELPGEAARFVMYNSRPLSVVGPPEGGKLPAPDLNALWVMGPDGVTVHQVVDKKIGPPAQKPYPRPKTQWGWHLVAFAPGGQRYAAHFGQFAGLYDTKTGFEPLRLDPQYQQAGFIIGGPAGKQVLFSPDGKRVAAVAVVVADGTFGLAVWDIETGKQLSAVKGDWDDGPSCAAFSPDGKTLAVGYKDHVRYLTADGGKEVARFGVPGPVTAVAYRPDGMQLAVGFRLPLPNGADREPAVVGHKTGVLLLDATTGKELRRFDGFEGVNHMGPTHLPVTVLAFSPDGKALIAGTGLPPVAMSAAEAAKLPKAGEVKVWRLGTDDPPKPPAGPPTWREVRKAPEGGPITAVAFAPNGKSFAVGGPKTQPLLYGADGHLVPIAVPRDTGTFALSYAPDGKHFATARADDVARYEAGSWILVKWPSGEATITAAGVTALAHSPDGNRLAVSSGKLTRVIDLVGGGEVSMGGPPPVEKDPAPVSAGVAWSPDGKRLALIRHEKWKDKWPVVLWGAGSGEPMVLMTGHDGTVQSVAWSRDGKGVASGGADGKVILWDPISGKEARRIDVGGRGGKSDVRALAFSPDGTTLAAAVEFDEGKNTRRVVLINPATGTRYQDLQFFTTPPRALAFSPDGKTLVVGCGDDKTGEVRLFTSEPEVKAPPSAPDPAAAAEIGWSQAATLTYHAGPVDSVAFAPDGTWFVSGGADGRVFRWDAATTTPQELGAVVPPGARTAVAVSPDGKLVAATRDRATAFFDPGKRQPVLANPPVPGGRAVAFSPAGERVAVTVGQFTGIGFYRPTGAEANGRWPAVEPPKDDLPAAVAWSPDGKRVVSTGFQEAVRGQGPYGATVWPVESDQKHVNVVGHTRPVRAVAWSEDGKQIATGGDDGAVILWDAATYQELRRVDLRGRNSPCVITALAFSPDGKALAAAVRVLPGEPGAIVRGANRVVLLDPASGKEAATLTPSPVPVRGLAFSPDGKTLLAAYGIDRAEVKPIMSPDEMKAAGGIAVFRR